MFSHFSESCICNLIEIYSVNSVDKLFENLKIGQCQSSISINKTFCSPRDSNATYQVLSNQTSGSGEEDFKGFHHIWAWRQSW